MGKEGDSKALQEAITSTVERSVAAIGRKANHAHEALGRLDLSSTMHRAMVVGGEQWRRVLQALERLDSKKLMEVVDGFLAVLTQKLPQMEAMAWKWLDSLFAPNVFFRQFMIAIALELGLLTYQLVYHTTSRLINRLSAKGRLISDTRRRMGKAKSYYEWLKSAEKLDELEGNNEWREIPECPLYNHRMLQEKMNQLNQMMQNGDVFQLMFTLRGGLTRNQFGLLNEGLYTHAYSGTKKLLESYLESVVKALNFVCDSDPDKDRIAIETKLAFFNETRHAYGRTALLLSGGAGLGYYHVGFAKALFDQGMLPRVLSGASAGSIISSMIGVRTDEELYIMFRDGIVKFDFFKLYHRRKGNKSTSSFLDLSNAAANSNNDGRPLVALGVALSVIWDIFLDIFWYGNNENITLMDTEHFRRVLRADIGNYTFQEAFDRTGRILNIIVAATNGTDPPRLLNYLTAPHVLIWSAVAVSSAAPCVFEPGYLYVRQSDGSERPESSLKWYDGSVENDLPMEQLAELFNINHFIVSQVNPQAYLFSSITIPSYIWNNMLTAVIAGLMTYFKSQFRDWCRNLYKLLTANRKATSSSWRGLALMFTQDYQGRPDCDINIMPWSGHIGAWGVMNKILANPTLQDYLEILAAAERKTWPLLHAIRSHCMVEMSLERCVQRLRRAVVKEGEQKAAQLASHSANVLTGLGARGRAPSFYSTPSSNCLVSLSGLSVTDPVLSKPVTAPQHLESPPPQMAAAISPGDHVYNGGGGMMPHHLGGWLEESSSTSSVGLNNFIDGGGEGEHEGEKEQMALVPPPVVSGGFTKSHSMAQFYYRRSEANLAGRAMGPMQPQQLQQHQSQPQAMGGEDRGGGASLSPPRDGGATSPPTLRSRPPLVHEKKVPTDDQKETRR